jgi:hypothetical protein
MWGDDDGGLVALLRAEGLHLELRTELEAALDLAGDAALFFVGCGQADADVTTVAESVRAIAPGVPLVAVVPRAVVELDAEASFDELVVLPPHPLELRRRLRTLLRGHAPVPTRVRGHLSDVVASLELFAELPAQFERLAQLVPLERGAQDSSVHLALVFPHSARWLDLVLSSPGDGDVTRGLLDELVDWLTARLGDAHVPFAWVEKAAPVDARSRAWSLELSCGGWSLRVVDAPVELVPRRYVDLAVGDLLLDPIWLPGAQQVQLLEPHTLVSSACLRRLATFIGETTDDGVVVMPASETFRALRMAPSR